MEKASLKYLLTVAVMTGCVMTGGIAAKEQSAGNKQVTPPIKN